MLNADTVWSYDFMKPLTDARLYRHRDICRILEVNGGIEFIPDQPMVIIAIVKKKEDINQKSFFLFLILD